MSLINQALHKAQRDRTPNRMQPPGEQSASAYANSTARGMNPALVIGLVIAVAVLIGLVVGLSIVIFKGDSEPQSVAASPTQAPPSALPQTTTAANNQAAPSTPLPQPTIAANTPIDPQILPPATTATKAETAPVPVPVPGVVEELRKAREATEAEAAAHAKAAEEAAARAAAQPSEDIISWLGSAKITGVRLSETDSKVILNGKTYSAGEFVNFKLGLKVMVIQENRVLFVDNNGKKYLKRL